MLISTIFNNIYPFKSKYAPGLESNLRNIVNLLCLLKLKFYETVAQNLNIN